MEIDIRVENADDFDNTETPETVGERVRRPPEGRVQKNAIRGGEESERSPVPNIDELELRMCLRELMDIAPSDSSAVFFVSQTGHGYKGILKIRSLTGRFVAGAIAPELDALIEAIRQQIHVQLLEWRRNRRFV
jgi:hypothetical protein